MRQEIRICGFGGQGVITAAVILGKAATVFDQRIANQTQSYGPEARGGACRAEVVISDQPIGYPRVIAADVLVAMSQEAFQKYRVDLSKDGVVIVDPDLVIDHTVEQTLHKVPATKLAEDLGNTIVANIVMLGALTAIAQPVSYQAMLDATLESVPTRFIDLNRRALEAGFQVGEQCLVASRVHASSNGTNAP